jgi:CheY-like chemotaxis protein
VPPPVLVAGLDGRGLLLESAVLRRTGHVVEERDGGRPLLAALPETGCRLVVLGTQLPDLSIAETVRRIRSSTLTRHVSVIVVIPMEDPSELDREAFEAGANAVMRRPLDHGRLDSWIAKLLSVPRRVDTRVPVQGQVIGSPKSTPGAHFSGLSRNLSINGMLLASPTRLLERPEVELEFNLPGSRRLLRAVGRVVRDAPEITWPYLGYGVEFLFVPPDSLDLIARAVTGRGLVTLERTTIHSTLRRERWVYEILEPTPHADGWQSEIRRAPREDWRPGRAGPFYVVEGRSRGEALAQARAFILRRG